MAILCRFAGCAGGGGTIVRVRSREEVGKVVELAGFGWSKSAIARATGIPRSTVRDWPAGRVPQRVDDGPLVTTPGPYAYLLGLYLGDGFIARGPRAWCLRIYFDARHAGIIGECVRAVRAIRPDNCEHLDLLGIAWRRASDRNIAISRREAVAALDAFVGPKR